jgi:predicted Rdx family selenoprotein
MVKGFKDYNKGDPSVARLNDFEILKKLFPSVKKEGEYPDLETAKQKFADLAKAGRSYAQGFNPPQADAVLPLVKTAYDEYFENFLPKMAQGLRAYNKGDPSVARLNDFEILKKLFPSVKKEGDYPDLETAKQKFADLAKAGRPYAQGFNPPQVIDERVKSEVKAEVE